VIISRRIRWMAYVACMGKMENPYKFFVRKHEWKGSIRRYTQRWEKTEMDIEDVDWIHLTEDRDQWWALVNMVIDLQVP
jgi:hypothetical protein